jgi:hypothetical protein
MGLLKIKGAPSAARTSIRTKQLSSTAIEKLRAPT